MDMMAMVSSILSAQAGNTQMLVATSILKSNADAEKFAVQTLLGGPDRTIHRQSGSGCRRQPQYHRLKSSNPA